TQSVLVAVHKRAQVLPDRISHGRPVGVADQMQALSATMREVGGDGTVDAIGGHVPRTGKGRLKVTVVDIVGSHFRRRASDQFDIVHVNVAAGRGLTQIKV